MTASDMRSHTKPTIGIGLVLLLATSYASQEPTRATVNMKFEMMADRIASALKLREGERVLIRFDPGYFNELVEPLRRRIRARGAIDLGALEYVDSSSGRADSAADQTKLKARLLAQSQAFEQLLDAVDIYLWLPLREVGREIPAPEALALARWLDKGGARREIHFHWRLGSVLPDGLAGQHTPELDEVYQNALDIDYQALSLTQDAAIARLRTGTVRVQTPAGTSLTFKVGDRPFNRQNGDASFERMSAARVRVDREIELPAGVVRVAPLEVTVNGRIVIPQARFAGKTARNLKLEIKDGRVTRVQADENLSVVEAALTAGGESARSFREFGLGFNPKLETHVGSDILPYFGYGAGIVRMSLGDNQELGGAVRGGFSRWFFFADATVDVDGQILVRNGKLISPRR